MNPLHFWLPGTLLFVVGLVLLFTGTLGLGAAVAITMIGATLESVGIVLWLRNRQPPSR
jgi:hypothetical protein